MRLTCPNCDTTIPAANINVQTMVAVCPTCDTVFSFQAPGTAAPPSKSKRLRVRIPPHVSINQDGDQLDLHYGWWERYGSGKYVVVAVSMITVMWLLLVVTPGVISGTSSLISVPLVMLALVMLLVVYMPIALVVNQTSFTVDGEHLSIRHRPLPWGFVQRRWRVEEVDFVEARLSGVPDRYNNPMQNLYVIRRDGVAFRLMTQVDYDSAQVITRAINDYLHTNVGGTDYTQNNLAELFETPNASDVIDNPAQRHSRR